MKLKTWANPSSKKSCSSEVGRKTAFKPKANLLITWIFLISNIFNFLEHAFLEPCGHFIYNFSVCINHVVGRIHLKWTHHFWAVRPGPPWVFYRSFCPSPAFTDPKPGIDDQFLVLPADAWMNDLSTQGVFLVGIILRLCQL